MGRSTYFAPAGRATPEALRQQVRIVSEAGMLANLFDCIQEMLVILNSHRQIVFANNRFLEFAGVDSVAGFVGARPGEAVACACATSDAAPDGCGTSESCSTCGAVRAILASQAAGSGLEECVITRAGAEAEPLNLKVRTSQIALDDETFTVFAVDDISDSKRRAALERIFFHDVLNTAGAVRGMASLLVIAKPEQQESFRRRISLGAERLVDEINSYRVIAAAERNELETSPATIRSDILAGDIVSLFQGHEVATGKTLRVASDSVGVEFRSDPALLSRVLINMVKNALEATTAGGTVTLGCRADGGSVRFDVHNPATIPRQVALQIFRRSFSTKAPDRGLGTYSMKLIGERYLGGAVSFTTSEDAGTTFSAVLPVTFPGDRKKAWSVGR